MPTIMPIRQRSPTNALPEDPMAFQTMRTRNPDGTSTVYHVHESMANNNIPGFNSSHQIIYGGGAPSSNMYGGQQQQQHLQQPNVVYVQSRNDDDDDDDDESDDDEYEQPTTTTNSSSTSGESTALVTQSSTSNKRRRRRKLCQPSKSTSPLCIATGIIIALSFIIGYIFMIETIVNHNRNRPSGVQASLRSGSSSSGVPPSSQQQSPPKNEYTVQDGSVLQEQLNLEPKFYMMKPVLTEVTLETMLNKQQQQLHQQQKPSHPRPNTVHHGDGTLTVVQPRGTTIGEEQTEKIRTAEIHYSDGAASAKSRDGRLRKKK